MDSSDGRGSFFESKSSPRCHHVDEDPVRGFGRSAKPGYVAGFEKTAKTLRAERFPPPRHGPRRHSRLGLLMALDAARRPSPPRPPRGPRRLRRPLLRQCRDRHPCLHDMASSTAVRQLGFVAQNKKPAIHRCLRPRSRSGRHSCRPARGPVPAALHRRPHGPSATAPPR